MPQTQDIQTHDTWLDQVYGAENSEKLESVYDSWAERYDDDLTVFGYRNTPLVSGLACRYIADKGSRVLDAGCGTGFLGEILQLLGYRDVTGVDISSSMLAKAKMRNCYSNLKSANIGERLSFDDNHFFAALAIGVLTVSHAPADALDELVRVTRPGGVVIFSLTDPTFAQASFRHKLAELEARSDCHLEEETPRYRVLPGSSRDGETLSRIFVYRVADSG